MADTFYFYDTLMTLPKFSEKRIVEQILQFIIGTHMGNIFYGRNRFCSNSCSKDPNISQNMDLGSKFCVADRVVWNCGHVVLVVPNSHTHACTVHQTLNPKLPPLSSTVLSSLVSIQATLVFMDCLTVLGGLTGKL